PSWPWTVFFQAEDGVRDGHVTGVQTCALPISAACRLERGREALRQLLFVEHLERGFGGAALGGHVPSQLGRRLFASRRQPGSTRSEERRVGKEWSSSNSMVASARHEPCCRLPR